MAELSIGEVAKRTGLAASAIRYYEAEGLIPKAPRRGGKRCFDDSTLDRLALVELSKAAGFTVAEIKQLLRGFARSTPPSQRWRTLAENKLKEVNQRIAEAQRMKQVLEALIECGCVDLKICSSVFRR
ncbi:MAG: MerR family redox-sensitive transcriptional activator SoxR [Hyphomicrobiaceae bacterium]|jgi:MerR family redox-sensitive transcriptional activator SoxR